MTAPAREPTLEEAVAAVLAPEWRDGVTGCRPVPVDALDALRAALSAHAAREAKRVEAVRGMSDAVACLSKDCPECQGDGWYPVTVSDPGGLAHREQERCWLCQPIADASVILRAAFPAAHSEIEGSEPTVEEIASDRRDERNSLDADPIPPGMP